MIDSQCTRANSFQISPLESFLRMKMLRPPDNRDDKNLLLHFSTIAQRESTQNSTITFGLEIMVESLSQSHFEFAHLPNVLLTAFNRFLMTTI